MFCLSRLVWTRWASTTSHIYKLFVVIIAVVVSRSCISPPKGTADFQKRGKNESLCFVKLTLSSVERVIG